MEGGALGVGRGWSGFYREERWEMGMVCSRSLLVLKRTRKERKEEKVSSLRAENELEAKGQLTSI